HHLSNRDIFFIPLLEQEDDDRALNTMIRVFYQRSHFGQWICVAISIDIPDSFSAHLQAPIAQQGLHVWNDASISDGGESAQRFESHERRRMIKSFLEIRSH